MKKILCLLGVTVLLMVKGYSQVTFEIIPGQSKINYLKSEAGSNSSVEQAVEVKVTFKGVAPAADIPLSFVITSPYTIGIPINPVITNIPVGGYFISAKKVKAKPDTVVFKVNIAINATTALSADEFFDLQLVGFVATSDPRHRVTITSTSTEEAETEAKANKKNKIEIGAISIGHSFDFFGKDNALISYADAYIFSPGSISIGKNAKKKMYGFALKLYQNKSLTIDSLNTNGGVYKFINQTLVNPLQPPVNDSVLLKQEILNRKTSSKSNNWGMYLRLFRDISYTTNDKTKFYLGIHGEFLRREIQTSYEYKSEKDTLLKVKSTQVPYSGTAPLGKSITQSELYVAPFIEFVHSNKDINVHFALIPFGLNAYRSTVLNNVTIRKAFFMGQFDLIFNELNFKLGAECRGLFSDVTNQPYWNVYISKSFSWEKLKDLIL